jgi:hypothetical protein
MTGYSSGQTLRSSKACVFEGGETTNLLKPYRFLHVCERYLVLIRSGHLRSCPRFSWFYAVLPCRFQNGNYLTATTFFHIPFLFIIHVSHHHSMVCRTRYYTHIWAQSVEALRYVPEGRSFDSRWCHWNFSLTKLFRSHSGPGVDSASNRNGYQEYILGGKEGRCVGLTTLPPSYADCLEIWEPHHPGTLKACPGLYKDCFQFTSTGIIFNKSQYVNKK